MTNTLKPGTLTFVSVPDGSAPITSLVDGRRVGFEPELAEAIGADLGMDVDWVDVGTWAGLRDTLDSGRCDAILCCQAITEERKKQVAYTRPYAMFDEGVLVRTESDVQSPEDLDGLRIGAVAGTVNMQLAESFRGGIPVAFGDGDFVMQEMADAILAGKIDAMVEDELVLPAFTADGTLRVAFVSPTRNPNGLALRKDSQDLVALLDESLTRIIKSGQLREIWTKHFPHKTFPIED